MNTVQNIHWFGHASFSFVDQASGNKIYYIDPFDLHTSTLEKADLIFITHAHPDHDSPEAIQKIIQDDSVLIATPDVIENLGQFTNQKQSVVPNEQYVIKDFAFQTIPAYNTNPQRLQAHPKVNNWVGYIFTVNGMKIYHAGDTDFIEEVKQLKKMQLDIAMLPMGGTYTMAWKEAADAANTIAAKYTIPMHYKRLLGDSHKEAEANFKNAVVNSEVVILDEVK